MKIEYTVIRSNRKTITISVERDKSVLVRAPKNANDKKIQEIIEQKKIWLFEKIKHPQKYSETARKNKKFISGTSIMYLGRNYQLDIVKKEIPGIKFANKFIISRQNKPHAAKLLKDWYRQKAKEKLIPKIKYYAERLGVEYNTITIKELKCSWGSCSLKDNLTFNWKLIKAPMSVIEYIIVHELAHLLELNHTKRFWNIVKVQLPNYEKSKEWLKEHGNLLEGSL